jgi:hypothetical protein
LTTPTKLLKRVDRRCPGCGELLSAPHNSHSGYKCRTDGCIVAKVYYDTEPPTVIEVTA